MPSPRKTNGITKFEYSTDNSTWVDITSIEANESIVRFLPNNREAQTSYGGSYSYPEMREYDIQFLNRTIFDTIEALHDVDTAVYYRWTLDNDELHTTTQAVLPAEMVPVDVTGKLEGRGDRYRIMVSIPKDLITETIA